MQSIVYKRWHDFLNMPKKDKAWHRNDMAEEYQELLEAKGWISRWSEYADVVYTITRGRWDGYVMKSPLKRHQFIYGSVYMFPKYLLRFLFFRRAGQKLGAKQPLHEVRNPRRPHKLHHIANKYSLDPEQFTAICRKQLRYWLLLK